MSRARLTVWASVACLVVVTALAIERANLAFAACIEECRNHVYWGGVDCGLCFRSNPYNAMKSTDQIDVYCATCHPVDVISEAPATYVLSGGCDCDDSCAADNLPVLAFRECSSDGTGCFDPEQPAPRSFCGVYGGTDP